LIDWNLISCPIPRGEKGEVWHYILWTETEQDGQSVAFVTYVYDSTLGKKNESCTDFSLNFVKICVRKAPHVIYW